MKYKFSTTSPSEILSLYIRNRIAYLGYTNSYNNFILVTKLDKSIVKNIHERHLSILIHHL